MAEVEGVIEGALARGLETGRARLNALFAQARRATPALDAQTFAQHLRVGVAPIVDAVADAAPGRVAEATEALFEASLELVGKGVLGPRARAPAFDAMWRGFLPGLARHIAAAPRAVVAAATNALYNVAGVPGARPGEWVEAMLALAGEAADAAALLDAGKIAAWRAGLAHYREGALEACARLPERLVRAALRLEAGADFRETIAGLAADPWWREGDRRPRIVARVGAFRGFGGAFLRPPQVFFGDGRIVATDGEGFWALSADRFGQTLRAVPDPRHQPVELGGPERLRAERRPGPDLDIDWRKAFPELKDATSHACDAATVAVTLPLSHAIALVAVA